MFSVILISTASAGFLDWFGSLADITGMDTATTIPNITIGNVGPIIGNITSQTAVVDLSEGLPSYITASFLVIDFDGAEDIDNSTVYLNVTRGGADLRQNSSGQCYQDYIGSNATSQNYTCTIELQYWDIDGGWTCTAQIADVASNYTSTIVDNCLTINSLVGMNMTAVNLAWSQLSVGAVNQLMSTQELNITNTGNQNLTNITIQAVNLIGEETATIWIPSANFTATWGERSCDYGEYLINDTDLQINGSKLDFGPGNLEAANNATHICLEHVGEDLTQQAYSTAGDVEDWTITGDTGAV